jgi:iron complex outermembrane recepter protein
LGRRQIVAAKRVDGLAFAAGAIIVSNSRSDGRFAPIFTRARSLASTCAGPHRLRSKATPFGLLALLSSAAVTPGIAQTATQPENKQVGPVIVTAPKPTVAKPGESETARPQVRKRAAGRSPKPTAKPAPGPASAANEVVRTPLNLNAVATSASRLGLPLLQTPATVEIVDQQTMREQGYRTTTETAQGAVGVLSGDSAGAPAGFSMRGFSYGAVNVLYNGIWTGPQDITSRIMDTSNLDRVEFLKGPSSLMSGLDATGGAVNYVTRQPTIGPIQNELDTSIDSLGTYRTHFGSGGSTNVNGLDYRFDISQSKVNSFIDGDYQNLTNFSGQLNYRITDTFKVFVATEYKQDEGHAYWGTPLVPTSFAGAYATHGAVSGTAVNTFDGSLLGPLTVDSRTLTTNYNIADNSTGAKELWLRSGFEWAVTNDITIKDQVYNYYVTSHWYDSETYAFDTGTVSGDLGTNTIDRDRFYVTHNQLVSGNNADLTWDSSFFGMANRFAGQLQVSRNYITFNEEGNGGYPADTVSVIDPAPGVYGGQAADIRNSRLDTVAVAIEDRLKVTSMLALIGGVRFDDINLARDGINFDGTIPDGGPFSKTWTPVSYRAAYTFEPIHDLVFYSMYATAYDPAVGAIFSVTPGTSLDLTSSRIYETGVKQLLWSGKAEWTFSAYDIQRNNVYVSINDTTSALAGEIRTKGVELAGAVRPFEDFKLWGNVALTQARYVDFDTIAGSWSGNTPSNVAPLIVNAGASYRFSNWRWPVEIGGSVRHVGNRYLFEDDLTTMNAYTTADVFAFVDIPSRDLPWTGIDKMRVTFRVRNLTNTLYAAWSDPGYPDQVLLGAPRTYELSASAKW